MKRYILGKCEGDIVVVVAPNGTGTITSILKPVNRKDDPSFHAAIDGMESLILACACQGIDVASDEFQVAVQIAIDAIGNNV